jgi:hypothetical protein
MSLQLSFLTFILSAMLALLSEYIVQIHAASFARRRFVVSREIRSQLSARSGRMNVRRRQWPLQARRARGRFLPSRRATHQGRHVTACSAH